MVARLAVQLKQKHVPDPTTRPTTMRWDGPVIATAAGFRNGLFFGFSGLEWLYNNSRDDL